MNLDGANSSGAALPDAAPPGPALAACIQHIGLKGIAVMTPQSSNADLTCQQLGRRHRRPYGRLSAMRLVVGALVNLSGLLGLGWIALGR